MGRLPEYKRKPVVQFQPDPSASLKANELNAMAGAAAAVGDIGRAITAAEIRKTQIQNDNYNRQAGNSLVNGMNETEARLQKKYAGQIKPEKILDELQQEYNKQKNNLLKTSPNGRAAEIFNNGADRLFNKYKDANRQWADRRLVINTKNIAEDGLDLLVVEQYEKQDPNLLKEALNSVGTYTAPLEGTIMPELKHDMERDYKSNMTESMLRGMIDSNKPWKAEKILKSGEFNDALDPKALPRIKSMIHTKKQFLKAEQRRMEALKRSNPYLYLQRIGESVTPIDFASPEKGIRDRVELVKKHPDLNLQFFREGEVNQLNNIFTQAPIDQQSAIMENYVQLPPDVYQAVGTQLFNVNPAASASLGLYREGSVEAQNVAQKIQQGYKLTKKNPQTGKPSVPVPKKTEVYSHVQQRVSGITNNPNHIAAMSEAVYNKYVFDRHDAGEPTDKVDSSAIRKTIRSIIGNDIELSGGSKVLSIRDKNGKFVSGDRIKFLHNTLSNETLKKSMGSEPFFINPEPTSKKDILKKAIVDGHQDSLKYEMISDGVYRLYMIDPQTGAYQALFRKDKKAYTVDLKKLNETVGERKESGGWLDWSGF